MSAQNTPRPGPLAVRVKEACELLGVKKNTLYKLLNTGQIKSTKRGNCRFIPMAEIRAFLERDLGPAASPATPAAACGSCGSSGPGSYHLGDDGTWLCAQCAPAPQTA